MSTAANISAYMTAPCLNEDGEEQGTKLLPPVSAPEILELQDVYGCSFTEEVQELLAFCGGLEEGPMEIIDFKGQEVDYILPTLRGRFRNIAPDGFGNFWFYWTSHVGPNLGPIFYYQHEGPMLFYQADCIGDFVRECIRFMTPPYTSLINDVHEFRLRQIRTLNNDLLSRDAASADHELEDFLRNLPADTLIYDFRTSKVGDGVDLAKLDVIGLHPKLPVLALRKRPGLIRRLSSIFGSKRL